MKQYRILALILVLCLVLAVGATLIPWERYPALTHALDTVQKTMDRPMFRVSKVPVSPAFVIKAVLYLFLLAFVARRSRRLFRLYLLDRLEMESGHKYALETAIEYLIVIAGLAIGLELTGVNLNSLAILGGALGIGVGFGLQSIVNNFVSGLILLFEGPVKVGDRVEISGMHGDVVKIGARSSWVRTNDNIIIVIPNSEFIVKPVINWTVTDRQVRFSMPVGVSYGADPDEVRSILTQIAKEHPDILHDPAPDVIFTEFGDSSLNFQLRFWTVTKIQYPMMVKSDLYFAIFRAFKEHGIEIPFPQRDIHIRTPAPPTEPRP